MTLTKSKLRDLASASPLIAFYALGVARNVPTFLGNVGTLARNGADAVVVVQALAVAANACFGALLVALLILRKPPVGRAHGVLPRVVAVAGTFALLAFAFLTKAVLSLAVATLALVLVLTGTLLTAYCHFVLGRSFSIVPEARTLVTSGPYRFVRHPIYAFEEITVVGMTAQYVQPAAIVLLLVHLGFQLTRMHYEERVLASSFPEYKAYAARTQRLVPGIY